MPTSTNQDLNDNSELLPEEKQSIEDRAPQPPSTSATTKDIPVFGWSGYAERINGRFAMVGFIALLLVELFSQDTFLHWAGLIP
ncbi:chlorophyll a/b-binding protein [Prochlorococcus sp. MIT 1300]|uniref:chlorophyll a/b-binding protein n=1 Tax=Prochlorococcus sp. MIT 1300 TaxID=3096218 RepID=UPI002A74AC8B|nr:chlorophyll a/b-binding protein [Prochlorococcus sp. MIT 1300]